MVKLMNENQGHRVQARLSLHIVCEEQIPMLHCVQSYLPGQEEVQPWMALGRFQISNMRVQNSNPP